MKVRRSVRGLAAVLAVCAAYAALPQQPAAPAPMIKRAATMKISDHAYVILDDNVGFVPNVGIVVGERATLIVDTGLGPDNGAIVLEEARKLSDNTEFYLTATHFHPEHDLGATAFPASAKMIRWRGQQAETDEQGAQTIERFSGFSPAVATLLSKASYRKPDTVFDDEMTLDLGGVHVRLSGVGPAHTRGDTRALSRVFDGRADANARRKAPGSVGGRGAGGDRSGAGAAVQRSRAAGRTAGHGPNQRGDPSGLSRSSVATNHN